MKSKLLLEGVSNKNNRYNELMKQKIDLEDKLEDREKQFKQFEAKYMELQKQYADLQSKYAQSLKDAELTGEKALVELVYETYDHLT